MQLTEPMKWGETMRRKITLGCRFEPGEVEAGPDFVEVVEPVRAAKPMPVKLEIAPVVILEKADEDILDYCLCCWSEWMRGDADRDLRAKPMGGLMGNADGYGADEDEKQQARDTRMAVATDAMIDSMTMLHRWAIYTSTGVGTAWKFPRADLLETYSAARIALELLLRKNVCTGILF